MEKISFIGHFCDARLVLLYCNRLLIQIGHPYLDIIFLFPLIYMLSPSWPVKRYVKGIVNNSKEK